MISALFAEAKILLILLGLSTFLIITDYLKLLNFPKSLLQTITIPIQYGLYKTGTSLGKQFEFIVLSRRAAQENKAMTEQLAQILSENAGLRRQLEEARSFLEQEQSLDPQTFILLAARPIGISRFLLIDKGSDDGLDVDMPVVYKDNLLGKIIEVSPKESKVQLVSDPDSKISAFASNKDGKARGVLMGQFEVEMLLDKILHQEPVEKGDLIYTDGVEENMPKGLVVGKITQVTQNETEIFKKAQAKTIFDVASLEVVFVITN